MKERKAVPLTEKQRAFLEKLIAENKSYISNTVLNTLGQAFSFLYEECIGELYLLTCLKVDVAETHPNPAAWIIVCARLTAYTVMQKARKELLNVSPDESMVSASSVFDEALYNIWTENGIAFKLINELSPRERQVYDLIYIKGLSPKEAAKALCISYSTVRSLNKQLKDKILDKVHNTV